MNPRALIISLILSIAATANAAPRFANVFADHAVLQQGEELTIWGSAARTDSVLMVKLGGIEAVATVDGEGDWQAMLPAHCPSIPHFRSPNTLKASNGT